MVGRIKKKGRVNQNFQQDIFWDPAYFHPPFGYRSYIPERVWYSFEFWEKCKEYAFLAFVLLPFKKGGKKDYSIPKTPVNLWIGLFASWIMITTYPDIWEAVKKIFPMACLYFAIDSLDTKEQIHHYSFDLCLSGHVDWVL